MQATQPQPQPHPQSQQYRYFLDSLASEATKRTYSSNLRQYCKHLKLEIDDCIRLLSTQPSLAEAQIIDYIVHMKSKGISYSRINSMLCAIMHFYTMNDVTSSKSSSNIRTKSTNQGVIKCVNDTVANALKDGAISGAIRVTVNKENTTTSATVDPIFQNNTADSVMQCLKQKIFRSSTGLLLQ